MTARLLPPNASPLERAMADALGARFDRAVPVRDLWSPERCPEALLPWLAWAVSVDVWDDGWPLEARRRVVAESLARHRIKGSRAAVETAVAAFGLGEFTVTEGAGAVLYDGSVAHDGTEIYGRPAHWADYFVYVSRPISNAQAAQIRAALAAVQPARCRLAELNFVAALVYDGAATFDGSYNHGAA